MFGLMTWKTRNEYRGILVLQSVIESDVEVIVQHTRLDSRQAENAFVINYRVPGKKWLVSGF